MRAILIVGTLLISLSLANSQFQPRSPIVAIDLPRLIKRQGEQPPEQPPTQGDIPPLEGNPSAYTSSDANATATDEWWTAVTDTSATARATGTGECIPEPSILALMAEMPSPPPEVAEAVVTITDFCAMPSFTGSVGEMYSSYSNAVESWYDEHSEHIEAWKSTFSEKCPQASSYLDNDHVPMCTSTTAETNLTTTKMTSSTVAPSFSSNAGAGDRHAYAGIVAGLIGALAAL